MQRQYLHSSKEARKGKDLMLTLQAHRQTILISTIQSLFFKERKKIDELSQRAEINDGYTQISPKAEF